MAQRAEAIADRANDARRRCDHSMISEGQRRARSPRCASAPRARARRRARARTRDLRTTSALACGRRRPRCPPPDALELTRRLSRVISRHADEDERGERHRRVGLDRGEDERQVDGGRQTRRRARACGRDPSGRPRAAATSAASRQASTAHDRPDDDRRHLRRARTSSRRGPSGSPRGSVGSGSQTSNAGRGNESGGVWKLQIASVVRPWPSTRLRATPT